MHKNTKLLPYQRRDIFKRWGMGKEVTALAREYKVTRQTIYDTIKDAKLGIFLNRSSMNERYRNVYWGLKRLAKVEMKLEKKIKEKERRNRRYEKSTPGEMVHADTKRLPLLVGEAVIQPREYLFVAIDDYSRQLYADIFPDKTSYSAAIFAEEFKRYFAFPIQVLYSDNGSEYRGRAGHALYDFCKKNRITQGFTKVKHPWTNGKAERVIRTLMEEWHSRTRSNHISREHRRRHLYAYVDWYNNVRVHQSIGCSPVRRLEQYLKQSVNNACN